MENQYVCRTVKAALGLVICAFGSHLTIQANIGLAPWDAFSIGISNVFHCSYGTVVVVTGIAILLLDVVLKEKIGVGTLLDIAIVGKCVDFYSWLGAVPKQQELWPGVFMLIVGLLVLSTGIFIYMSAALGCGPRDALMMGLGRRSKGIPIGAVRTGLEGAVLIVGFLLGAKVGIGTVIAVFGLGFCIQLVFTLARFDAGSVEHDGIVGMLKKGTV